MSRSNDQTQHLSVLSSGHIHASPDGPSQALLEAFPNTTPRRPYIITLEYPEFTSLCPVTGQPDFGRIVLEYIPDALCVETKSFKLYMFAFRNHHSFMETITNTILDDICAVVHPLWCRVQGLFAPRGATQLNVYAEEFATIEDCAKKEAIHDIVRAYRSDVRIQKIAAHPASDHLLRGM